MRNDYGLIRSVRSLSVCAFGHLFQYFRLVHKKSIDWLEKNIFLENPNIQPDLEGKDYIVERQLKPESRKDIVEALKLMKIKPTSMIDISDGLASEILHICKQENLIFLVI